LQKESKETARHGLIRRRHRYKKNQSICDDSEYADTEAEYDECFIYDEFGKTENFGIEIQVVVFGHQTHVLSAGRLPSRFVTSCT
jgi:hypothetical protein